MLITFRKPVKLCQSVGHDKCAYIWIGKYGSSYLQTIYGYFTENDGRYVFIAFGVCESSPEQLASNGYKETNLQCGALPTYQQYLQYLDHIGLNIADVTLFKDFTLWR